LRILVTAAPVAGAIAVFGVVFGATASARIGPVAAIAMSLFIFSGTVQFATLGLLGAGIAPLLLTVTALNARNLVLGSVIRPLLSVSRARRALLGWFLIDEAFGLAVASGRENAARVLLVSGLLCYAAWQVGTLLGVAGARVVALEGNRGRALSGALRRACRGDEPTPLGCAPCRRRRRGRACHVHVVSRSAAVRARPGCAGRRSRTEPLVSWELIAILAVFTYGSRAAVLALLPQMSASIAAVLERMPSPLFAGLAASALITPQGSIVDVAVLAGTAGAILVAPRRSLPLCLVAGIAAYVLAINLS
jgi:hypothetical protein